jgi:hypothetical protein
MVPLLIVVLAALLFEAQDVVRLEKVTAAQVQQAANMESNAQAVRSTDARIESLLIGLIRLASETNMDARALVIKHQIQWTPPQTTAPQTMPPAK